MAAVRSANGGNRRAKSLEGKDLLTEFHWCAAYALRLGQFAPLPRASSDNPTYLTQRERIRDGMRKAGLPEGRAQSNG